VDRFSKRAGPSFRRLCPAMTNWDALPFSVMSATSLSPVMPALVAGIHVFLTILKTGKDVDGRDKPGHDELKRGRLCPP
jgi:hypothetical protein